MPPLSKMKRYRGWSEFPAFLADCREAAAADVLVTPPIAAAILGYSKVSIRRLLNRESIQSWAWYEPDEFHATEIFVSVHSLVWFGLKRGRLGDYEDGAPLSAVINRVDYEQIRREIN